MKTARKFLVVLVVIALFASVAFAANVVNGVPEIKSPSDSGIGEKVNDVAGQVAGFVQIVGIAVTLVVLVVLGIQWIVATPAKKAELKGKLWNIVIGLVILLLGSTILAQVINFLNASAGGTTSGGNNSGNNNSGYFDPNA